jgi:hypothetical protein
MEYALDENSILGSSQAIITDSAAGSIRKSLKNYDKSHSRIAVLRCPTPQVCIMQKG